MKNIAVLGCGIVGSGVVELIEKNHKSISERAGDDIQVKSILDIRDITGTNYAHLVTNNPDDIFNDTSIDIIVETIGGTRAAFDLSKRALTSGKHLVSSNKELVSVHGPELIELARENGLFYMFEASVGGGIPIIRPLNRCLSANEINSITGILNGTTNYILTLMKTEGVSFEDALKEAQMKGYAEADPTADIDGHDTCRKIAILSSIAYSSFVDSKHIHTEGISGITINDIEYANQMNCVIKLLAESRRESDNEVYARVGPVIMSVSKPLANVEGVFNAIVVNGDAIGDAMFYGQGAGKFPTASAVVADIIDIVGQSGVCKIRSWQRDVIVISNILDYETKLFVRIAVKDTQMAAQWVTSLFGDVDFIYSKNTLFEDELAFITENDKERLLMDKLSALKDKDAVSRIVNVIRAVI